MQAIRVGIVGASGYSGLELTRILSRHAQAQVVFVTSDRWVGQMVASKLPASTLSLSYVANDAGLAQAKDVDVVFLATPAETSLDLAPKFRAAGTRVVDLSGAFRLKNRADYPRWYNFEHHAAETLAEAIYGLPELFRESIRNAKMIANPGCYATAAALQVAPFVKAGLVHTESIVINAASGVSGAGRKASEEYGFMEIDADFRAYRTLKHQHTPEILQTVATAAGTGIELVFTPHLLPIKRGILSTAVMKLKPGVAGGDIQKVCIDAYGREPLIRVVGSSDAVRIAEVAQTSLTVVGASSDGSHVVCVSAIDNLLKGASSQAVQNMNLMFGVPETTGLL